MAKQTNRIGEENYNNYGTLMKIVEYKGALDMIVEFQDEYKYRKRCAYKEFKNGKVKNPYDREVYEVGYCGDGKYEIREEDGKITRVYQIWHNMLQRCYDPYFSDEHPTYRDCMVCDEWHNFQKFAEWYEKEIYEIENDFMCLDKDILYKGNKIYSPENCVLVPNRINLLFVKCDKTRGEYPIGVSYYKRNNNLSVMCRVYKNNKSKRKFLGYFPLNKPFQAFHVYKVFKESYIKQVADEYKDLIPNKLYEALYKYEIEIND